MDSHEETENGNGNRNGSAEALPPPPPPPTEIPPDVVPIKAEPDPPKKKRVPMARRGSGTKGQKVQLLSNHFKVNVTNVDGHFYHYSVCFCLPFGSTSVNSISIPNIANAAE